MTSPIRPKHHVIYIPGLGDSKSVRLQRFAVSWWWTYGVYGHCHPVIWNLDEPFEAKLTGVLHEIDELLAAGNTVSIIGSSAGASMALHAYEARKDKICAVVLICGELGSADHVKLSYYEENPAFKSSMERLPETLKKLTLKDRKRIMSLHPVYDEIVPIVDTKLDGARMFTSISVLHTPTIALTLTIDFYIPAWFLMKWSRQIH